MTRAAMTAVAGVPERHVRKAGAVQAQPGRFDAAGRVSTFDFTHPSLRDSLPGGDLLTVAGRRESVLWYGCVLHQIAHQAHTSLSPFALGDEACLVLEELRVEAALVRERPQDVKYLAVHAVATTPPPAHAARWLLASYAALTLGRADAGVYPAALVQPLRSHLEDALTARTLSGLRQLWQDALTVADHDDAALLKVADAWRRRVGGPPPRTRTGTCFIDPSLLPHAATGEFEDPTRPDLAPHLRDAVGEWAALDLQALFERGLKESAHEARMREVAQQAAVNASHKRDARKARQQADRIKKKYAKELAQADALCDDAGDDGDDGDDTSNSSTGDTVDTGGARTTRASKTVSYRAPDGEDIDFAKGLTRELRRAQFRGAARVTRDSPVPPGRLRGREMVLREVQRLNRQEMTAKPFRVTVTRDNPEPPLTLGLLLDTSGSMSWASSIFGSFAWAAAHAMSAVDGTFTAVTFGGRPKPLVLPGRAPTNVPEHRAGRGREMFVDGVHLVDGLIGLEESKGARVLLVCSDGRYGREETRQAARVVSDLVDAGVHVLWVSASIGQAVVPSGAHPVDAEPYPSLPARLGHALARILRDATV